MTVLKDLARTHGIEVGDTRLNGTVCRVYTDRRFGYIRGDADAAEYFFHANQLDPTTAWHDVHVGCRLSFCLGRNTEGVCAVLLARDAP
jgi:cold shock CspA family protein